MKLTFFLMSLCWVVASSLVTAGSKKVDPGVWYYYKTGNWYYRIGQVLPSEPEECMTEGGATYCFYRVLYAVGTPPSQVHEIEPGYDFVPWSMDQTIYIDEIPEMSRLKRGDLESIFKNRLIDKKVTAVTRGIAENPKQSRH